MGQDYVTTRPENSQAVFSMFPGYDYNHKPPLPRFAVRRPLQAARHAYQVATTRPDSHFDPMSQRCIFTLCPIGEGRSYGIYSPLFFDKWYKSLLLPHTNSPNPQHFTPKRQLTKTRSSPQTTADPAYLTPIRSDPKNTTFCPEITNHIRWLRRLRKPVSFSRLTSRMSKGRNHATLTFRIFPANFPSFFGQLGLTNQQLFAII